MKLHVRLGPIALQFVADVEREQVDEVARRLALVINAREAKGRGTAQAQVTSSISPAGDGTLVDFVTDLELRGPVAQYGRGVVADVASTLTKAFADCLSRKLANDLPNHASRSHGETPGDGDHLSAPVVPIEGLRALLRAVVRTVLRRPGS
jgi:carbon monoxide dehydrogenase subunit G